ncbi:MAG: DNA/RNA non-specific endonuclease [Firmicutes bacterium]|nr:DNA/RNA non-specific endonuclease [Bacillota bacterium]
MAKEYVVMGAKLECNQATAPSNLVVLPVHREQLTSQLKANIGDAKPFVNVLPFGLCKSLANPAVAAATSANRGTLTPMPCTPACSIWIGGKTDLLLDGMPMLMVGDIAVCPLGAGMIEVKDSGQGSGSKGGEIKVEEIEAVKAGEIKRTIVKYGEHFAKEGKKKVLKPNVEYTDEYGYTYMTDEKGRIVSVKGKLILKPEEEKGRRKESAQLKVVKEHGIKGVDDGGHLIGNQFYGSGDIDNLVPQNSKVNRSGGDWYKMEQNWANISRGGNPPPPPPKKVEVCIKPIYTDDSGRPSKITVIYKIDGVIKPIIHVPNPV